jgi:hypothetical protein
MHLGRTPSVLHSPLQDHTQKHCLLQVIGPLEPDPDRNVTSPTTPLQECKSDQAKLHLEICARINSLEPPFVFAMTPLAPSEDGDRSVSSCGRRLALHCSCGQPHSRFLRLSPSSMRKKASFVRKDGCRALQRFL